MDDEQFIAAMRPAHLRLIEALNEIPDRVIACSGGIDSMLLATIAHELDPDATFVAHAVTAAVPSDATARVVRFGAERNWNLELVQSGEFDDERYLSNPVDRCYFCKTNLYETLNLLVTQRGVSGQTVVLSGANTDDLSDYRPGLVAADENRVRHPYVEAGVSKSEIRAIARDLELDIAELPASPCLASRLYTGTRVEVAKLRAVELGEATLRELTGLAVVRCRIRGDEVLVEVPSQDRALITAEVLSTLGEVMQGVVSTLLDPVVDPRPYRAGQAVLKVH